MKKLLENINASEKLISKTSEGKIDVISNIKSNEHKIKFSNVKHLSPEINYELYSKIKNSFNNENMGLANINFDLENKNEKFYTYENILLFLLGENKEIKASDFFLDENENWYSIITPKEIIRKKINTLINELTKFLKEFSITNKKIEVICDPNCLSMKKLERQLVKEIDTKDKDKIFLNETIRPKHKKVNLEILKRQTNVYFEGFVKNFESRVAKSGTDIYTFILGKEKEAVMVTVFNKQNKEFVVKNGDSIRVYGVYEYNDFRRTEVLTSFSIDGVQFLSRETLDGINSKVKHISRNEFHIHTKMSVLDSISDIDDYVHYAELYNIDSLTIMDHNSAQSFPDAYKASKKTKVKINYGVEFDVFDDVNTKIVINERNQNLVDAEYVFFDLETTSISAYLNEIIEFGAVKYKNNSIIDRKQIFIKPKNKISKFTTELTSITNSDLENAPSIEEAILEIKEWIGDSILVAHNASFDFNFLNKAYIDNGLKPISNPVIDSMKLSWHFHSKSRAHRLGVLAKNELVNYDPNVAHRADYDAEILAKIFERFLHKLLLEDIRNLSSINKLVVNMKDFIFSKHITVISKNNDGLRDLNKFVSIASIDYLNKRKKIPMLPLSIFYKKEKWKNLLVGSSCSNGFLFNAIMDNDVEWIESLMEIYDYIEIFPPTSYQHLISNNTITKENLEKVLKKIIDLGKKHSKLVIVSSNAHYSNESIKEIRDVIISAQRVGGSFHPLHNFRNPNSDKPNAHLRTTEEIFKEFEPFIKKDLIQEIVIDNPLKLQNKIDDQVPIKNKLYTPKIKGSEEKLLNIINENIENLYGKNVDDKIRKRIDKELDSIIKHGFSIIYYLSSLAVKKSTDDGYLVGSRGSVGSSIVATLSGITEVNPLSPHYRCPKCKYHEFNSEVDSGFDLEDKSCPVCETKMVGDGHQIPFETFLGFNADKVPDIDLNFSRENQSSVHLYIKELLGKEKVFRAGTISTAAFKTAIGYVKNYEEQRGISFNRATIEWLSSKIEGAKRTSGQHPGGLIVIPSNMEVYDFTPINYPGDDWNSEWKTTHFDFHSIHDNLLKLDFLGHLDPSSLHMLEKLTKVNPKDIPMNNKEVISLFKSNKALNYINNYTGEDLGIIGVPEFGTTFVRELVRQAKPKSFSDLVRISGLSHGTDVWTRNAQELINNGTAVLSEVISVRDDILTYLISKGIDNSVSFNIMESVRKGFGITLEQENIMRNNNIPEWYINSCKLIKYMFPKAHATAYVMMAYRIAWYKINYPLEYYATFFTKRDVELNLQRIIKGINEIKKHIQEIKDIPRYQRVKKDDDLLETYNIILEMYSRGIYFSNININKSQSVEYVVDKENNKITPPFSILEGIGDLVAKKVVEKRNEKPFESIADFEKRSGLMSKVIKILRSINAFDGMKEDIDSSKQLFLFE